MEPDCDYEQALIAAELHVEITAMAWASQYRKRKADRNPQVDEEVRGRWLAAKENLREIKNSGALGGLFPFTTKEIKQQEVESALTFANDPNSPIRIDNDDHDSMEASAETNLECAPPSVSPNERAPSFPLANERAPSFPLANERAPSFPLANECAPPAVSAQLECAPPSVSPNERAPSFPLPNERGPSFPLANERAPSFPLPNEGAPPAVSPNERAPSFPLANERAPSFHLGNGHAPPAIAPKERAPGAPANSTVPPSHALNQPPAPNEPGVTGSWMDGYFFPDNLYPTTADTGTNGECNTRDQGYFASLFTNPTPGPSHFATDLQKDANHLYPSNPDRLGNILPDSSLFLPVESHTNAGQIDAGATPTSIAKHVPPLPMNPTSAFPTAAGDSMDTASTIGVDTVPNLVQLRIDDAAESILSKVLKEWASASRVVPIHRAKMQERLKSVTASREQVQNDLATREDALCQPRHRTINEIRSALGFIDQGYTLLAELSEFIQKIECAIEENERKTAESERLRPLVAERKRLVKERDEALASLANIEMELLKARQNEIATLARKISELDDQLGTATSETSTKTKGKRAKSKKGFCLPDAEDSDEGPSDEEDDRREMAKWNEMDSEERKRFTAKVRKSIDAYLASGDIRDFRATHRNALRTIQSLLPEESFSSKSVATAILTTSHSNTKCRYHTGSQKVKIFDGIGDILVQGVGYPGKYNKKGVTAIPRPGYMNCGCLIDDALLDFFFWKTLFITSTRPDRSSLSESMKGDKFQPRIRAFVIQLFKSFTFLTANDIFTSARPFGKAQRELHLYKLSMQRINEWVTSCTRVPITLTSATDLEEAKKDNGSSIVV